MDLFALFRRLRVTIKSYRTYRIFQVYTTLKYEVGDNARAIGRKVPLMFNFFRSLPTSPS